jgi:periplasmic protein CpxP/Spy
MTTKSASRLAAILAGLMLPALITPTAFAQTQAPAQAPAAPAKPKAQAVKPPVSADRVEKHISDLHAKLQITQAQQTEWDQFAQIMRENAANMNTAMERRRAGFATLNAADNMQSYAEIAQQHAQDMQKLATTFKSLYGAMSDEQKKNADTIFRARGAEPPRGKG